MENLLSVGEVAERVKRHYSTIYRLISDGRIPTVRVADRSLIAKENLPAIRALLKSLQRGRKPKGAALRCPQSPRSTS